VRQSSALVELLRLALHVANFMNAGSARQARAIQLKSLEKFAAVKGIGAAATAQAGAAAAAPLSLGFGSHDFEDAAAAEVPCPAYASKSLMHFVAHLSLTLAPSCVALSAELPSLERAAAVDLAALDGTLKDTAANLQAAKAEADLWCKDADDATARTHAAAAAAGAASRPTSGYALLMGAPAGVLELRAALARAEQAVAAVGHNRRGASQLAAAALAWLGEPGAGDAALASSDSATSSSSSSAGSAAAVQDFLATALGVSRAFAAAVGDNAAAADAESRRQKKLAAEAEVKRLKEEAHARAVAAQDAAAARFAATEEAAHRGGGEGRSSISDNGGSRSSGGGGLGRGSSADLSANRWGAVRSAAVSGKLKRGSSRTSIGGSGARAAARGGRKDAFAGGGGGLFGALSKMRTHIVGKAGRGKGDSESSEEDGDDLWRSSESDDD
jgi:hypothetical protein